MIQRLSNHPHLKKSAAKVLMAAFQNEPLTTHFLKFDQGKYRQRFLQAMVHYFEIAMHQGHQVWIKTMNGEVKGVAVVTLPQKARKNQPSLTIAQKWHYLRENLSMVGSVHFRHLYSLLRTYPLIRPFDASHATLELLGVDPHTQGHGIGSQLLEHIDQWYQSQPDINGLYLTTGSQRSRDYYQQFDYQLLKERHHQDLSVYQMVRHYN